MRKPSDARERETEQGTLAGESARPRYQAGEAEPRIQRRWAQLGTYQFDPTAAGRPFVIDTPPPTVSGSLHLGHVFSYSHADFVARYHRMRGDNVMYPFGFDDNGLPTELYAERVRGVRSREIGRTAFTRICIELTQVVEARFERFWQRLGLGVDWRLRYSTLDARSRRISQASLLDLHKWGLLYRALAPTSWCTLCRTGVAQAEAEDKVLESAFLTLRFELSNGTALPIATTRPELLPACVAVMVHPDDSRYAQLAGLTARTPLFAADVPLLHDGRVDPSKGTGAVMCCTFGDATDVAWQQTYGLPVRAVFTEDGHLNELGGPYEGLSITDARDRIGADLDAHDVLIARHPLEHSVGTHERCGTPLEYRMARQWFIRILGRTDDFLRAGHEIRWHPAAMRERYEAWVKNVALDWNISRQRYFGIPFPFWSCTQCGEAVPADASQLPIDPSASMPPVSRCPACGGSDLAADTDVIDTWATSSLTPEILGTLLEPFGVSARDFDKGYRPLALRPNAHDIIRTWDFYTIVRSLYARKALPWSDVMISGHALDPDRRKLSKSNREPSDDVTTLLEQHSADAIRYWAASVGTGNDTVVKLETFKEGRRLVTKLWNAAQLVLPHLADTKQVSRPQDLTPTDRWILARLDETVTNATSAFDDYEYARAVANVERFFWADLCDTYLEAVKFRLNQGVDAAIGAAKDYAAARFTLYRALLTTLQLLAPVLPHITDELYTIAFASTEGVPSVHRSRWPQASGVASALPYGFGEALHEIADACRRWKSARHRSLSAPVSALVVTAPAALIEAFRASETDLRSLTRASHVQFVSDDAAVFSIEIME